MAIVEKKKKEEDVTSSGAATDQGASADPYGAKVGGLYKDLSEEGKGFVKGVIVHPRVTEKTTLLQQGGVYSFNIRKFATKPMVKRAVEMLYKVNVEVVRVITTPRKKRMRGRLEGWKSGSRKALVKIKAGQMIELP
jgi:large subunit ribosomal protein L23